MVDNVLKARRTASPRYQHVVVKAFGEDASAAENGVAIESAHMRNQPNASAGGR
jgi:hypothetical protein